MGAFALGNDLADSAVIVTLSPDVYNVQVADTNAAGGTMLMEFYELP